MSVPAGLAGARVVTAGVARREAAERPEAVGREAVGREARVVSEERPALEGSAGVAAQVDRDPKGVFPGLHVANQTRIAMRGSRSRRRPPTSRPGPSSFLCRVV